ncbi:MAG: endolytic transglycosylase MltG [bacterium]|nr:endolytic transglycosylase MltG [bacterium]
MKKTRWKTLLFSLLLIIFIGGFAMKVYWDNTYENYLVTPVDPDATARITFTIAEGETGKTIAAKLAELELIPSEWAFYQYIKEENIAPRLEAGKFILKKSYTIPEIAQYLTQSRTDELVVTIREGLTVNQVDDYLSENSILPSGSFLECARKCEPQNNESFFSSKPDDQSYEGYLFPDTYFVDPETVTPQNLFNRMIDNFTNKLNSELRSNIAKRGYSIHQIVTMASLIEKESQTADEKPIISGILWKRLEEGIALGVDATVRYAVSKWTGGLTQDDLNTNSPYNTRKRTGLPPGPISNFSLESLKAAISPEASDYYYYLHGDDGQIHYARTNEEHNQNKQKYLQ